MAAVPPCPARCASWRATRCRAWSWWAAPPACPRCSGRGRVLRQRTFDQSEPGRSGGTGAAIQANQLAGNNTAGDLLLLDVIPLAGHRDHGRLGGAHRLAQRDHPTAKAQDFTTRTRTDRLSWPSMWCRASAIWCRTAAARCALRVAAFPHGGRGCAHPCDLHRRCRWPAERGRQGAGQWGEARIDVKPAYGLSDDEIAHAAGRLCHGRARHEGPCRGRGPCDADRMLIATQPCTGCGWRRAQPQSGPPSTPLMVALRHQRATATMQRLIEAATEAWPRAMEAFAAQRA